ncbi:hypothetical protein [Sphaerisporangium corydalis]|uniref:Guanylate cyclase domain-containing protein n=1 Tax=Sphaerisporangium corydalis TaxID=1441875 RepID=A0ABV9EL26_9ACTN|nr:hypothetical protein [Sphaerisporangium corydalis]
MNDLSGEVRRLCIALDVDKYDTRSGAEQREIQRRLAEVIAEAGREAGLDRLYAAEHGTPVQEGTATVMFRQEQRDGLLLLLPSGVSEARVIAGFVGELRVALRKHNRHLGADAAERLRLRVAFHQGPTWVGDGGFAGRAVTMVCRLRDSDELGAALARDPGADLAVIVSAQLFEDVIEHEYRDLRKHMFHHVRVRSSDVATDAWISVPDSAPALDLPHPARPVLAPPRERAGRFGPIVNIDEY